MQVLSAGGRPASDRRSTEPAPPPLVDPGRYLRGRWPQLYPLAFLLTGDRWAAREQLRTACHRVAARTGAALAGQIELAVLSSLVVSLVRTTPGPADPAGGPPPPATWAEVTADRTRHALCLATLSRLPAPQCCALLLTYLDRLHVDDAALVLGCSARTVIDDCTDAVETLAESVGVTGVLPYGEDGPDDAAGQELTALLRVLAAYADDDVPLPRPGRPQGSAGRAAELVGRVTSSPRLLSALVAVGLVLAGVAATNWLSSDGPPVMTSASAPADPAPPPSPSFVTVPDTPAASSPESSPESSPAVSPESSPGVSPGVPPGTSTASSPAGTPGSGSFAPGRAAPSGPITPARTTPDAAVVSASAASRPSTTAAPRTTTADASTTAPAPVPPPLPAPVPRTSSSSQPPAYTLNATVAAAVTSGRSVQATAAADGFVPAPPATPWFAYADIDFGDGHVAHDKPADCAAARSAAQVGKRYAATHTYAAPGTYTVTFRVGACGAGPARAAQTTVTVSA